MFDQGAQRNVAAILFGQPMNVTHYTGCTFGPTERAQAVFINKDDEAPWYF